MSVLVAVVHPIQGYCVECTTHYSRNGNSGNIEPREFLGLNEIVHILFEGSENLGHRRCDGYRSDG